MDGLDFIPLEPELFSPMFVIWRRYQKFTPAFNLVLNELLRRFGEQSAAYKCRVGTAAQTIITTVLTSAKSNSLPLIENHPNAGEA